MQHETCLDSLNSKIILISVRLRPLQSKSLQRGVSKSLLFFFSIDVISVGLMSSAELQTTRTSLCLSQNQASVGTPQRALCAPRCHERGRKERSLKINTSTRSASLQPAFTLLSCNQWKKKTTTQTSIFISFDPCSLKRSPGFSNAVSFRPNHFHTEDLHLGLTF